MTYRQHLIHTAVLGLTLAAGGLAFAGGGPDTARYCLDVEIEPFHMMPDGSCTVRDYWDGELRDAFYPFTKEDHLFNCEVFGGAAPLPTDPPIAVPSSVVSQGPVTGTIGGHPFTADLFCASLTNWYQDYCPDPQDSESPCFGLKQPFLGFEQPYPRVTEVSVFDGAIMVSRGKKHYDIPLVMATRAAGITHIEVFDSEFPEKTQVGASITHSLLGMVTYDGDDGDDVKVLDGSLDLLLQGHIFFPKGVNEDPGAARIKGVICSRDLYERIKRPHKGKKRGKGKRGGDHHDDD